MNKEEQIKELNKRILTISGEIVDRQRELQQLQWKLQTLLEDHKPGNLELLVD